MQVSVRFAESAADRDAVYRLRAAIYNQELGRGYPADGQDRMTDRLDGTARLLLAEQNGEAVGTLRLNWGGDHPFDAGDRAVYGLDAFDRVVAPGRIVIFSRFATKAAFRGGDVPGQLIDAMVRFAVAQGVCVILCDCRPQLINLYLRLGMRVLGPVVTMPPAGILVPLILLLDDPAYIAAAGSRIAPLLRGTVPDGRRRDALLSLLPADPGVVLLDRPEEAPGWAGMVDILTTISPERFPIFQGLHAAGITRLMTRANLIACNRGDVIVRQGAREDTVFVVLAGAVDVVRDEKVVIQLKPGGVFGEIAFLARAPRTADVVAACDTRLVCLRPSMLTALIANEPDVAAPFLLNLSRILAVRLAGGARAAFRGEAVA